MYYRIKQIDPKNGRIENDIPGKILIGTNDIVSDIVI